MRLKDEEAQGAAFSSKLASWKQASRSCISRPLRNPRLLAAVAALVLLSLFSTLLAKTEHPRESLETFLRPISDHLPSTHKNPQKTPKDNLHLIIPTNKKDVNLCKLILGASLLGYPNPVLAAWNENFDREGILGGGSHLAKVSKVLEYLQSLGPDQDNDIVFMMDAYDIWLQLPASVLLSRYHQITADATTRMEETLGATTVASENLNQTVLFGAGKRCAPNQSHTVACYALAESPLPDDLYGPNTDTIIGLNYWYSQKQRYLNSGYIMGTVGPMRRLFAEAWSLIQNHPDMDPVDDGTHGSDFMYHGSDQSIFAAMYGRQEYAREKLRLKHSPPGTKPRSSTILGTKIDNVLNPSISHEKVHIDLDHSEDGAPNPWEFGIHLDYWSSIGHQTVNSEIDGLWLRYGDHPVAAQIPPRTEFDCPARPPKAVPQDVVDAGTAVQPPGTVGWDERSLYTHLCLSTVPVLLHHNGVKERREWDWTNVWWQGNASAMLRDLGAKIGEGPGSDGEGRGKGTGVGTGKGTGVGTYEEARRMPRQRSAGGAWTDGGEFLGWEELCPGEWNAEIFRGNEP